MPALVRPRSATAKLSWSSSRPASARSTGPKRPASAEAGSDLSGRPAANLPPKRPASARYLPRGRTTLTELDKLLLEAKKEEEEAARPPPPPPPKPLTDAEKMEQQRREWMAKDDAFEQAAKEREQEKQRVRAEEHEAAERAKKDAAVDAEHDKAVQARLRRLGLAGDGKAKARLRNAVVRTQNVGEGGTPLTKAEAQHRDALKVLSSFHTGTYEEIERQVDHNFGTSVGSSTAAPRPAENSAEAAAVSDADFDLGLANAKNGVGDHVHAGMFCKLHALWLSACDAVPTDESKQENNQVRAMVAARFLRYQQTWPKSDEDPEVIALAQYTASQNNSSSDHPKDVSQRKIRKSRPKTAPSGRRVTEEELRNKAEDTAGVQRRPQSGPARQGSERQRTKRRAGRQGSRPASGPARVGWSAEAEAYVARIGLVPPLGRPPSAQPVRSGDQWIRPHQQDRRRPVSAPARLAATVVARWSHHTLGCALRGWRDAAQWRAAARQRLHYCVNRMIDDRLYRCIDRWRAQTILQQRAKELLRRTVVTWNNQSLVHAFNSWKGFIAAEANKYGRLLAMWKGDGRRTYFNMWKDAVQLIKDERPASHEFFQTLGLATFREVETVPEVWKVGQLALQSDSDDSSDCDGDGEVETPHAQKLRKERKARGRRKRRSAAKQSRSSGSPPRNARRGLNKRLMRYYDGRSPVKSGEEQEWSGDDNYDTGDPLGWSKLETSAVRARPKRVPATQAVTRKPSLRPTPHDIVTAALEGRLRNNDPAGVALGYLGPAGAGTAMPSEANVYGEEPEREAVLSDKPDPEREVEERAKELYAKIDDLGQLHYEGRWISHAYRPSVSRVDTRRGAISTTSPIELPVAEHSRRRSKTVAHQDAGIRQASAPAERRASNIVYESCMDATTAAAAAVMVVAAELDSGVSAEEKAAALARNQRLAVERERGWQIEAAKLRDTRLITKKRGAVVSKKKRASLWQASTSVCVIC